MPPRWPRKPSRRDPEFLCSASGLVFFQKLYRADWPWLLPLLGWWGLGLGIHSFWLFFVARYPDDPSFRDPANEDSAS